MKKGMVKLTELSEILSSVMDSFGSPNKCSVSEKILSDGSIQYILEFVWEEDTPHTSELFRASEGVFWNYRYMADVSEDSGTVTLIKF